MGNEEAQKQGQRNQTQERGHRRVGLLCAVGVVADDGGGDHAPDPILRRAHH